MAKTTVDAMEERTLWCMTEFAKQSFLGGMLGLLVSVIAFKRHTAVSLYGAGLGGGYAAFSCSQAFEKLNKKEPEGCPWKGKAKPVAEVVEEVKETKVEITEEQSMLLNSLQMLSAIKDRSQ